jgi:hypothetical protein
VSLGPRRVTTLTPGESVSELASPASDHAPYDVAMTEHQVQFTSGSPEIALDPLPPAEADALTSASALPPERRRDAVAAVAARDPRCLQAWAELAELTTDPVERYAYARVGYHRGLDALRAAGWRGSGYVRWRHESNRGFLRSLDALRQAAAALGETDEEKRCDLFLRQLDPEWRSN